MELGMYMVYDRKTDAFGNASILLYQNDDLARRAAHGAVLDASTEYSRYASDFSLWHVGVVDVALGVVTGSARRKVCEFDEFRPVPVAVAVEA